MSEKILFTSESVSEGHPDKVCDQISDAILDACLADDPSSRVACEVFATTNLVVIGGEITTSAQIDYEKVARDVMEKIGYTDASLGIDARNCEVKVVLDTQSPDIAMGTNTQVGGAGDQGIMFGYATNETEGYMPLAISIAHQLVRVATEKRKNHEFKWARPDMKSQVTIDYTDEKNPRIDTILMSVQHDPDFDEEAFSHALIGQLDDKELFLRLDFIVDAMEKSMPDGYSKNIETFFNILGPELAQPEGMFNFGWWLWPIGRYVERYGREKS